MISCWILLLTIISSLQAYEAYEIPTDFDLDDYTLPKRTAFLLRGKSLISENELPLNILQSRMMKRRALVDDGFTKRATSPTDRLAGIPRSGLMISGRGWMPGFVDQPRIFKRAIPLENLIVRPIPNL